MNNISFPYLSKKFDTVKKDLLAWLTVSFVLVPQSIAYAELAWLPLVMGLYSAFIPVVVASIFGRTQKMISSSITIVSLMTSAVLGSFAYLHQDELILLASFLALLVWLIYILLGYLKLWVIVDFLSHPVVLWFTNAAAILTIISQLPKIFWVNSWNWVNFLYKIINLSQNIIYTSHFPTAICWFLSLLFILIWRRIFSNKYPIILFLILFSILISYKVGYSEVYWWKIVGNIWSSIPYINTNILRAPYIFSFYDLLKLSGFAVVIAIVWFAQTISVAKYLSYKSQERLSPNKELIVQWLANISSSFSWGYAVAWSLSRSALNIRAGAQSRLSWVFAWIFVAIAGVFLTKYLHHLPSATLWVIIIVAVYKMVQIQAFIQSWKIEKHDSIIAIITFFVSVYMSPNIEIWIISWIILSLVFFIYRSMRPKIIELSYYKDGTYRDVDLFWLSSSKHIWVYRFDWNLYFANCGHFETSILNFIAEKKKIKFVILDFEWVNNIDSSAEKTIVSLMQELQKQWVKVYISGVRTRVFEKLNYSHFIQDFWEKHFYKNIQEVVCMIHEKYWKDIDTRPLRKFKKDKDKAPELEKDIIKKIEKIWD